MMQIYDEYAKERRLHILTLAYSAIVRSPGPLIALYFAIRSQDFQEIAIIAIALFFGLVALPAIILQYYYFSYYINEKEIVIRSGVLSRKQRNIPIERVQNIDITQNFLQRLLNIVRVQIETAGGAETEGLLEYVSKDDSDTIKKIIQAYQYRITAKNAYSTHRADEHISVDKGAQSEIGSRSHEEHASASGNSLFTLSHKDLVFFGMMRFRPLMIVFMAWILSMAQQFYIIPDFADISPSKYAEYFETLSTVSFALFILLGIIILLVTSWIADIIFTVFQYWNFRLSIEGDKLYTEYGLFSRRTSAIPLKKLQMLALRTNPVRKLFGYYSLALETAGFGIKDKKAEVAIPSAPMNRVITLSQSIRKYDYPDKFTPISKKSIRRAFVRYLLLLIIPGAAGIYFLNWLAWGIIFLPLLYLAAYIRWQRRGYMITGDTILVKQGFLIEKISVIQVEKIQTLNIHETFFQRRLQLATLNIDTAAMGSFRDAGIVDIDREEADVIMQLLNDAFRKATASKTSS